MTTLSLDELNSALVDDDAGQPIPAQQPKGKGFLTAQFPILSTPYFVIYLQGAGEWVDSLAENTTEDELLALAFKHSKARALGRAITTDLAAICVKARSERERFYADKGWHKGMIGAMLKAGASLEAAKVASRAFPLEAIDRYLNALAQFLTEQGFSTNAAYLAANINKKKAGPTMSLADLESVWDQL